MIRYFRLKKSIPGIKAGAIFSTVEDDNGYHYKCTDKKFFIYDGQSSWSMIKQGCEQETEWFEEVFQTYITKQEIRTDKLKQI